VEVGSGKESTTAHDDFKQLVRDITLQIAAGHPFVVSREEVDPAVLAKEKEIATEQVKMTPHKRKELDMILQLVNEAEAILTSPSRSLDDFGRLLHESWQIKRTLTQKISNANIDEIYEAGLNAGALGGKLLGAGGGGFMLFFVPPERRKELRVRLRKFLNVPFTFSNAGSRVIVYEPEEVYEKSLAGERCEVYAQDA